ncbi:AraC family transcriptional regulator [Streptacidiphilus sp. N1-12]|uniref:AraC family transcriptional regulator n=2 Tax=Streptacidiphilus alkalitolerans TaxID=3342712 RepID=A0ABV6WG50_9ACTN
MDVLANALAAMRVGPTRIARTGACAPWGLGFPAVTGATFHVLLKGSCWLLPAGPVATGVAPVRLGAGDVLFLRDGNPHALADDPASPVVPFAPSDWSASSTISRVEIDGPGPRSLLLCGAYQLGRTRPHPLMAELPEVLHLPAQPTRHPELRAMTELLAAELSAELDQARPGRDGIVPALVDAMLLYILRAWVVDRAAEAALGLGPAGWPSAITDRAVGRALQVIYDDPARPWTVQQLGAHGGLSRSVFAQRFTAMVGEPPLTCLTWWRMTMAGRLLRDSDMPLSVVAQRVGYSSEFAFSKAFRREFGTAPGRYRREPAVEI